MKKTILFVFILFTVASLCGQNPNVILVDSLKTLLSKEKTDTTKIAFLVNIGTMYGYAYGMDDEDSSFRYGQDALKLSKTIGYIKGEIYAQLVMERYFINTGNYTAALQTALENKKSIELFGDSSQLFRQMSVLIGIYGSIGNNKMALYYGKRQYELVNSGVFKDSLQIKLYEEANYFLLGGAYASLNQPDSALHYWLLCYKNGLKHYGDESLPFPMKTLDLFKSLKESNGFVWVALSTVSIGSLYFGQGKDSLAFFFYQKCIPYAMSAGRIDVVARAKLGLARIFQKEKQADSAFYYTREAMADIKDAKVPRFSMFANKLLSELYHSSHQYDSAYKYLQQYVVLNDSLNNQTKITQTQNLAFNETLQQQHLAQVKNEARLQYETRIKFYVLAAIILIILIIAFFLLKNIRHKRKANEKLYQKNQEIETQRNSLESALADLKSAQKQLIQSEKMASLGELTAGIAHEIQNPLNFVNNFSEVNSSLIDELEDEAGKGNIDGVRVIVKDIKENSEKINYHGKRADNIVKGMMQHSRNNSGIKEPTNINALCDEYLRLNYHGLRAKDKDFNATMNTDFDSTIGKINIVPQDIGRVLLNLYNNAFYAVLQKQKELADLTTFEMVSNRYEPTVFVSTKKSNTHVIVTVSDNGNGVPQNILDKIFQPFFTTKPTGEGTGLGLSLSYDIIKAHDGEIKVETKEGEGTKFVIRLPLN
jgi:two-component system NtrC family sensor kinase